MSASWALAILAAALAAKAEPAIVVRPATEINEARAITLRDIAEFHEIDGAVIAELEAVKLASAPAAGGRIEFSGVEISKTLRGHKVWQQREKPTITIPSRVVVTNVSGQLTEAELRTTLVGRWQDQCNCRVELNELMIPKIGRWQPGATWRVRFPAQVARGAFSVAIEISDDAGGRLVWVKGRAALMRRAAVATRQIAAGERIQSSDVVMAERDITFARDAVMTAEELIGRKVRQTVAANEVIFAAMVEREKALKRGDLVRIVVGENEWEVALTGVAEQDGFIGDTVKIRNAKSNQSVMAVVTGLGEVRAQ